MAAKPAKASVAPKGPAAAKGAAPAAAEPAKKEEKKKEKISQKDRPHSKKKHANVKVWKLYKIEGGKAVRKNEPCPRCGLGTFLASYKNRKYCGKCGWSQIGK
jgi:ubiquitin-small subunit ribosomal protein S27Ae